jgi:hypothetical protein
MADSATPVDPWGNPVPKSLCPICGQPPRRSGAVHADGGVRRTDYVCPSEHIFSVHWAACQEEVV